MANETQQVNQESWFRLYKPTQGYWTRMLTAVGGGAVVLWGASWIFRQVTAFGNEAIGLYLKVGAAILWIGFFGTLLFWLVGKKPNTVDFLVSVEGEMKKVNWSTWPEVIGSTKVVVLFVVLMSLMLVIMDTLFMGIFSGLGVLQGPGIGSIFSDIANVFHRFFTRQ
jgi:preprotein translocase SecE subunit